MRDAIGPLGTGSTACTPGERDRARAWFQDPTIAPMSFRWLCLVLDLDPDAVARRLQSESERAEGYERSHPSVEDLPLRAEG